jgi:hypothetical protein
MGCGQLLVQEANFCTSCGTPVDRLKSNQPTTATEHLITAIQLLLIHSHPGRILDSCIACLQDRPSPSHAALASVLSMSCYARLEKVSDATAVLCRLASFMLSTWNLPGEQRAEFVKTGLLIEELQAVGDRDLRENPAALTATISSAHLMQRPRRSSRLLEIKPTLRYRR